MQLREASRHPFGAISGYVPLGGGDIRLYRAIREAVPVVDAAIMKVIRLTGGFTVSCSDPAAERELAQFIRSVDAGRGQRGLQSFLDAYLDSMITCGRAVGEIVTYGGRDIAAVRTALSAWFNGERLGRGVLRAELGGLIWAVPGVANYALTLPAADLAALPDRLPVAGTLSVTEMA